MALSRWLQKTKLAETTIKDGINSSPKQKSTLGKCFQSLVAVVMAVLMFVMPIQTVYAAPNNLFTDSGQALGNSKSTDVSLADVDGDGDLDAVVANFDRNPNKVWLNDGTGHFSPGQDLWSYDYDYGVSLKDLDQDGDIDAFFANSYGQGQVSTVWLNDGTGNFTQSPQRLELALDVGLGDLDGDGDIDSFMAKIYGPNKVLFNDGTGKFTDSGQALGDDPVRSTNGYFSYGMALKDIDGDGDLDALLANTNQKGSNFNRKNQIWFNNGNGYFSAGQGLGNSDSYGVSLGDLDGDGDIDAFFANEGNNNVWLNDGRNHFTLRQALGNSWSDDVSLEDVDGDGDLDAFVANHGLPNRVYGQPNKVWLNDSRGNFTDSYQALGNSDSYAVSLGDVDGDGDIDAFVANDGQPNRVWLNNLDQYINHSPTNLTLSKNNIDENQPANSVVGIFSTTDSNSGDTFTYQLVSGSGSTDNAAFTIDNNQLKINTSPDFETKSTYSIRVQTTDSAGETFQKEFTINVNDINEPPTNLTLSKNNIDENQPANSVVGTFSTTDSNSGDTFTYQLVSGSGDSDNSAFTIDNNQLKINTSPDFETKSTYSCLLYTSPSPRDA